MSKTNKWLAAASIMVSMASSFCDADTQVVVSNYQLWATTNGNDIVRVIPTAISVANGEACSDPDSYMVKSTLSAGQINRIYSTLLAAKISGKPVRLVTSGCMTNRPAIVDALLD